MFVRYRKLVSDGFQPRGVAAKIACQGRCDARPGGKCPVKPRCRWRIGLGTVNLALPWPYRLQVQLVENRREGGRVRQEHVATLGSIDGWLLPEFWEGIDPEIAAKVKADNWDNLSVTARVRFWEGAKSRLEQLSNRLDPKTFRIAVHKRVPWPMQVEREFAEAREDFRLWKSLHAQTTKMIEQSEELIATATKENLELRQNAFSEASQAARAAERLAKLMTDRA